MVIRFCQAQCSLHMLKLMLGCADKLYELQHAWGLRRLVDGMSGCGGNVVAMASSSCKEVIAVDTCRERLDMCLHNADVYGVRHKVKAEQQDFFALAPTLQARAKGHHTLNSDTEHVLAPKACRLVACIAAVTDAHAARPCQYDELA